ncbi:hypothetical protein ACMAUO_09270 [Gluconacetobacter sp. Hr-1-5]|uniref:hypothetical protein n=1 Tax=Gluconacetobacter sp. Hr-1-5 TaxID=3395370 RepID=UPI003B528E88
MSLLPPESLAPQPARRAIAVWPWPIMLGVLTLFGLLSALLGQRGIWLPVSWAALSIPLIVAFTCLARAFLAPSSGGG